MECVGVYAMTNNLDVNALFPLQIQSSNPESETETGSWSQSPPPSPLPTPTPTFSSIPTASIPHMHVDGATSSGPADNLDMNLFRIIGGQVASSRGFVSAFHLGPQGKRAVWVERRRGSLEREVFVWAKGEDAHEVVDEKLSRKGYIGLEGKVVFMQGSYDLRSDLFH